MIKEDPAAILGAAVSLYNEAKRQDAASRVNLSDTFSGMDSLMREVHTVAADFERWACFHVDFDALEDVWPYTLEDSFGKVFLEVTPLTDPNQWKMTHEKCLQVAQKMGLPMVKLETLETAARAKAIQECAGVLYDQLDSVIAWSSTKNLSQADEKLYHQQAVQAARRAMQLVEANLTENAGSGALYYILRDDKSVVVTGGGKEYPFLISPSVADPEKHRLCFQRCPPGHPQDSFALARVRSEFCERWQQMTASGDIRPVLMTEEEMMELGGVFEAAAKSQENLNLKESTDEEEGIKL